MLELSPPQEFKPINSALPVEENMKRIQDQVGALIQRLSALEKQVTVLMGKTQDAR